MSLVTKPFVLVVDLIKSIINYGKSQLHNLFDDHTVTTMRSFPINNTVLSRRIDVIILTSTPYPGLNQPVVAVSEILPVVFFPRFTIKISNL
ncbi:hypothetical protein FF38_03650 [Lucilia cuprina]|uniref:Uncharacterized protein n=1 Tax=Lucilia cuprina TaxID=7375 RepID=A0A0L0CNX2_LUCCU|nr:hypothetical protein FF38_03650 [Lucilia cuprina]